MRARLLDLGEVGPVRSQSAYHAVLAGTGADDDPVVLLVRPAAALVSVGDAGSEAIDLQGCLDSGLPLVRRRLGGPTEILDENDLLIQIVMPAGKAPSEAMVSAAQPVVEVLGKLGISATADASGGLQATGGRLGRVQAGVVESALCIVYSLAWSGPAGTAGACSNSVSAEMAEPVSLAELAELLLAALEHHYSLELIPSMPSPSELEAIYEWDGKLLLEAADEAPLGPEAAVSLH